MKRKRIQYNELSEDIYAEKDWTKARLFFIGFTLLFVGFLLNISPEEKINKYLQNFLSKNTSCPIQFEKIELFYFPPKILIKKPIVQGSCFQQYNHQLELNSIKVSLDSPTFYPPGLRFHIALAAEKSQLNLFPIISFFSQSIKIEKTLIDSQFFAPFMQNNISPLLGLFSVEGFFEFKSGVINDGAIEIASRNLILPAQNINGFELSQINLESLNITAHFLDSSNVQIEKIQLGSKTSPVELSLNGELSIQNKSIMNSKLNLNGELRLSSSILLNYPFIKLFLPEKNANGIYKMKINGPLYNPGIPQFL